jgi:hypothetical protein
VTTTLFSRKKESKTFSIYLLTARIFSGILVSEMRKIFRNHSAVQKNAVHAGGGMIPLYRRHAARAMAEERWSVAEIFLDRIIEVEPRNTEAWLMKGLVRQHCREDDHEAMHCFRKVITLGGYDSEHPHVQRARRSLGLILSTWS